MKLLYNPVDGEIFYAVPDRDWFWFTHSTQIPLEIFEIDEITPENKAVCIDLLRKTRQTNAEGNGKYFIEANSLMEREGWVQHVPTEI